MIKEILRMGGCKTEKEFLKKYPTEESFLEIFPQARPLLESYKNGGLTQYQFQKSQVQTSARDNTRTNTPNLKGIKQMEEIQAGIKNLQDPYTSIVYPDLDTSFEGDSVHLYPGQGNIYFRDFANLVGKSHITPYEAYMLSKSPRAVVRTDSSWVNANPEYMINLPIHVADSLKNENKKYELGTRKNGGSLEAFPQARPLPRFQAQKSIVGRFEDWIDETGRSVGKAIANNSWLSEADINKAGSAAGHQIQQTFTTYDPNKSTARNVVDKALAIGTLGKFIPHPVTEAIGNAASMGEAGLAAYDASQAVLGQNYGTAGAKASKALSPAFKTMQKSTNPVVKGIGLTGTAFNNFYSGINAAEDLNKGKDDIKTAISASKYIAPLSIPNTKTTALPQVFKSGGYVPAFPQQPTEDQFFNYSYPTPNIPRLFQTGGLAFPQAPNESRFFNYGPPTPNIPRLFQTGGMAEMAEDEGNEPQQMQDEDELSAQQGQRMQQQGQQNNPLMSVIEELTSDYNIDPGQMVAILQSLPQEMLEDLNTLATSDPQSAASSLMEMYQTNSNQPIMAYGGVPTGQGLMEFREEPMGTISEEYGGSVFNYGQFPAIMEKGGSVGMNKQDSFLPEKLQKFIGKLNENATMGKLKEAQEEMNAYYGFKKGGQKKLKKYQYRDSVVGPRDMGNPGGYVYMQPQIDPADITNAGVTSSTIGDPDPGANVGLGMYPGQGVLDPNVLNTLISNRTPAGQPYSGPPMQSAGNSGQPLSINQITGMDKYLPEYNFMTDVNKYLEEKDKRAPSAKAPGDEITRINEPSKSKLRQFYDKKKDKWNKKTGIQKAETILNVGNRIVGAREKMIEDERQEQVNNRLYNPANWAAKYPVNRGKWDVNTSAFDPYNTTYGSPNMAAYGGELPRAQSGLDIKMRAGLGFNANQLSWPVMAGEFSQPDVKVGGSLQPVDRDDATLEAEDGETAMTDLAGIGIPQLYDIGGEKHSNGGTPLDLPDNSFIFSEFMKLKDKDQLAMFGINKAKRGGVSFADISKKFKLNDHIKALMSPDSDELTRDTAQANIVNANMKLGKLALIQESTKNFPDGIPLISLPYLSSVGITPDQLASAMPTGSRESDMGMPQQPLADNMAKYGANVISKMRMKKMGGDLPFAQEGNKGKAVVREDDPGFLAFGASGKIKMIRDQFQEATREGDTYKMRELAKAFRGQPSIYSPKGQEDKYDIPFSVPTGLGSVISMFTGNNAFGLTEEDEVEDMADILENKANQIETAKAAKVVQTSNAKNIKYVKDNVARLQQELATLKENPDNLSTTELFDKQSGKERELSNYYNYLSRYWHTAGLSNMQDPNDLGNISKAIAATPLEHQLYRAATFNFGENKPGNFANTISNYHTIDSYQDWYNANKLGKDKKSGVQEGPVGPDSPVAATAVKNISTDTLKNWKSYSAAEKAKKAKESGYTENEINSQWWRVNQPNIASWINGVNEGRYKMSDVPAVYKSYVEKEIRPTGPNDSNTGTTPKPAKRSSSGTQQSGAAHQMRPLTDEEKAAISARRRTYTDQDLEGASNVPVQRFGGPLEKFLRKFQKDGEFTQFPQQSYTGENIPYYEIQPKQEFGIFGTQMYDPNLGHYTVYNPQEKKNIPVDMEDFYTRQGDLLNKYKNGIDGFKKDILSKDDKTRQEAAYWFQNEYNALRKKLGLTEYFFDQPGPDPYGVDKKFGLYTYSAPGYKEKKEEPGKKQTPRYICKDGKIETVTTGGYETANEAMANCGDDKIKPGPGLTPQQQPIGSPFWTEDIVNTGAAFRNLGDIKKYLPWQAAAPFYAAQPTFESPERALAAAEEALTTGIQGASAFGNAQGYASAASSMAGNEAAQAANIISDVANRNVQTANQFEMGNKQAYNQYMQNQADRATDMYNKSVIANQQFDNSRREAKDEVRKAFVNAWTNRGKTQTLNAMYSDQYYTDPRTGYTYMTNPKAFEYTEPTYDNMPDYLRKIYDQAMANKDYKTALSAYEIWKEIAGKKSKDGSKEAYASARNIRGVTDETSD